MKCPQPYKSELKNKITHVFTTTENEFKLLHKSGFKNIWYPEYIAEFLIKYVSSFTVFFSFNIHIAWIMLTIYTLQQLDTNSVRRKEIMVEPYN